MNYLFVLLFLRSKIVIPKNPIVKLFLIYIFISYFIGIFIYSNGDEFFLLRQLISFVLFLSLFLLLFIRIKIDLDSLMKAIIIVSSLYSLHVIYVVFTNSAFSFSDIYFIKGGLREYVSDWPQRYVVLLVFAFIVSFSLIKKKSIYLLSTGLIGLTIILSFTRSSYLAVIFGMLVYFILNLKKRPKITYKSIVFFILFLISVVLLMNFKSEQLFVGVEKIFIRLVDAIELFLSSGSGHEGSDSDRLRYWGYGFNVLEKNIATGTGFAGIYLFYPIGSIHSQYMDILLRIGLIGLLFYLYLWFLLFKYYFKNSVAIFSGLVAIFIFGFSHETTKLTYIGLLFFVLLNYAIHGKNKEKLCAE